MSAQDVDTKAFEEKINAQLQQTKAQLAEFESRAKTKMGQAEMDTINRLKTKQQEIDKKRQNLKTVSDAKLGQAKTEINSDVANLKSSLADLATKLKKAG